MINSPEMDSENVILPETHNEMVTDSDSDLEEDLANAKLQRQIVKKCSMNSRRQSIAIGKKVSRILSFHGQNLPLIP